MINSSACSYRNHLTFQFVHLLPWRKEHLTFALLLHNLSSRTKLGRSKKHAYVVHIFDRNIFSSLSSCSTFRELLWWFWSGYNLYLWMRIIIKMFSFCFFSIWAVMQARYSQRRYGVLLKHQIGIDNKILRRNWMTKKVILWIRIWISAG